MTVNITLKLLKQCFYENTEYGPAIFQTEKEDREEGYTIAPLDRVFYCRILPEFLIHPSYHRNSGNSSNKTTMSYLMNRRLDRPGMKKYLQTISAYMAVTDHMDSLIRHCDAFLTQTSEEGENFSPQFPAIGFSSENFETVTGRLAPLIRSDRGTGDLTGILRQLSRIHPGAALAFLLLYAVLPGRDADACIQSYLSSPSGRELLVRCQVDISPSADMKNAVDRSDSISGTKPSASPEYAFLSDYGYSNPIVTFVGRRAYLSGMMSMLHDSLSCHHLFLYGMSGIGKTELAKKYAMTYRKYYRAIQMLHYRNSLKETICFELPVIGFDDSSARQDAAALNRIFIEKLQVLRKLMDDHCLLIIDNMNNAEDPDLSPLIEQGFPLLITTQVDFSERGYQTMQVHALETGYENIDSGFASLPSRLCSQPGESRNLSDTEETGITLQFFQDIYGHRLSGRDLGIIHGILTRFSGHTLITELLARQMKTSFLDASELYHILETNGIFATTTLEKVSHQSSHTPKAVYDYIRSILSPEQLSEEEQYILKNMAVFPLAGIPVKRFQQLCQLRSSESIWRLANRSLMILKDNGEDEILSLHPLIQELVLHNLSSAPEDYACLLQSLAELSRTSWSRPKWELDPYHDIILTVLSGIHEYSEETLQMATDLLEYAWQYGHFEFVIRQCEQGMAYAEAQGYGPAVRGALCRVAGNCLYSAGIVYRGESTRWFQRMLEEYRQVNDGKCGEMAYALKNAARAQLNQAVTDFGLRIFPKPEDSFGYVVSRRFDCDETRAESEHILTEALQLTEQALNLLDTLISGLNRDTGVPPELADAGDEDSIRRNALLSCKGDVLYIRVCILLYLHTAPDEMLRILDTAINGCYLTENDALRSLSETAAGTLKAKVLMLKQDYRQCDRLLVEVSNRERSYRGTDQNTHLIRICIARGDSAFLQKHPGNAYNYYGMARKLIQHYNYLDKGRYYEEVSEKYLRSRSGQDAIDDWFYITPGL